MPTETITKEKPRRAIRRSARFAGAVLTSAAAFAAASASPAHAETLLDKKPIPEFVNHKPKVLKNPNQLSGAKIKLGPEVLLQIKSSTVQLAAKLKVEYGGAPDSPLEPWCTAVVVRVPGQDKPFISTAAHCMSEATGSTSGAFTEQDAPNTKAVEITDASPYEYFVLDPSALLADRLANPIASISKLAVSAQNKDIAFASADSLYIPPEATSIRPFNSIPGIELKKLGKLPLPGTPVALYGEPYANGFEPIAGTGVYLGRVWIWVTPDKGGPGTVPTARQLDIVGINPKTAQTDNCNFGTSGSIALFPEGQTTGNLSIRVARGYGPDRSYQEGDSPKHYNFWLPEWESQLNINLRSFSVICGYTVMDAQTPNKLLGGFNTPIRRSAPDVAGYK